jgi:hypothetical protein
LQKFTYHHEQYERVEGLSSQLQPALVWQRPLQLYLLPLLLLCFLTAHSSGRDIEEYQLKSEFEIEVSPNAACLIIGKHLLKQTDLLRIVHDSKVVNQ